MKVIHLISGGDTGGAKTHVHSLLQGLNRHIQADMVCFTDGPFAQEAREEGFADIAYLFEEVAKIEKEHEERYRKLLANVKDGLVFSRDGDMIWQCSNCGHIHVGPKAPEVCPVCAHPQAYFQLKAENY